MKALVFSNKPARFAAAAVAGAVRPGAGSRVGPLALRDIDLPDPPGPDWVRFRPRLAGICGSDLATIDGAASRYFEPIVSFPFVPGHEVVGDLDDGSRAVLVPVLHCAIRNLEPCARCRSGHTNRCENIGFGYLDAGLQTGFCAGTGGGWSTALLAHPDQLVAIDGSLSDEAAVMVEPTACAVHAASVVDGPGPVVVLGAGTLGLLAVAALGEREILVAARYPHQRTLANELGAHRVLDPADLDGAVRLRTRSMRHGSQLAGGAPWVLDCVGSDTSLAQALRIVAPGGTVVVVGMPGPTSLDLTGLWHREVALRGSYAYLRADFSRAVDLVCELDLGRLVSATYPLDRYRDALEHAADAGRRGAVRVAFDLRHERERETY